MTQSHEQPHDSVVITGQERVSQARHDEQSGGIGAWFAHAASKVSEALGSAWAFLVALLIIVTWALTGPIFGFNDTWQLVINTGTTIVTFLMVFVIQNTQNRGSRATELKLDELIRAVDKARDQFIGAEDEDDAELKAAKEEFEAEKVHDAEKIEES
jgi:Predicted small integral membrane protein